MARYSDFASSEEAVLVETDDFALVYDKQNKAFHKKRWSSSTKSWSNGWRAPFSAIVCKDGSTVWAEDSDGKTIASGEAGVDDASVIQSAINNTPSYGVCKLIGDFTITSAIKVDAYKILDMEGAYLNNSNNSDYCIRVERENDYSLYVNIIGGHISGGAGGVKITSAMFCKLIRTRVLSCNVGLDVYGGEKGSWYNEFHQVDMISCSDKGVYIHKGADFTNNVAYFGGIIENCGIGVYIESGDGHNFHGTDIEGNNNYDIYNDTGKTTLFGCRIENPGKSSVYCGSGYILIIGGYQEIGGYAGSTENIHILRQDGRLRVRNLEFNCAYSGTKYVYLGSEKDSEVQFYDVWHGDYVLKFIVGQRENPLNPGLIFKSASKFEYFGIQLPYETKTSDSYLTFKNIVFADASSAPITLTLHDSYKNYHYYIAKIDDTDNVVTIAKSDSYTINGRSSYKLHKKEWVMITFDGSEWRARPEERNYDAATFSGDGSTTDFLIGAHGLSVTDASKIVVKVSPVSSDAINASPCVGYVDPADTTKIRVKFSSAPASGADNVQIVWEAQVIS
ncbi:MAG: hypothetical protein DRJ45_05310 [Thermoprotei archaeon]|nr:MAG: hypothetical protein DRJ45_05310 [Thermoprotei archaeon]